MCLVYKYTDSDSLPDLSFVNNDDAFVGWYADAGMTVPFDLGAWLAAEHAEGEELVLFAKREVKFLLPLRIEKEAFETKVLQPLEQALNAHDYSRFCAYFSLKKQGTPGIAEAYPVTAQKGIDIYVYNDNLNNLAVLRRLEALIIEHTDYTLEDLAADHAFAEYVSPYQ